MWIESQLSAWREQANRYLGIRTRDWPLLLLMLAHVFLALALMISLRSVNSGLFLSAFPASVYPWYFLAESVLSFLLSVAYSQWVAGRVSQRAENLGLIGLFMGLLLLGRLLLLTEMPWVYFALPVVCDALVAILLLQSWALFAECVDSRKARRIFPFIGLGGTCGGIFGGWLVATLASRLGTPNLLLLAVLLLGGMLIGVQALLGFSQRFQADGLQTAEDAPAAEGPWQQRLKQALRSVTANRLLLLVLLIMLCVRVSSTIMDYQLQLQLKAHFDQNDITAYMGTYLAVTSFATLVIQLLVENRIINAYGVVWGMGSTPVTLTLGLFGFLISPSLLSVTFAKFLEQITKNSLFKTAVELAYLPFDPSSRRRLRMLANGLLSLTTVPLASLTIMLFSQQQLVLLILALLFAGLGVAFSVMLQSPYTRKLHDSLMRRRLLLTPQTPDWQLTPAQIETYLTQPDPELVAFVLDLLRRQAPNLPLHSLKALLWHEQASVREGALRLLARQAGPEHVQLLVDVLSHEADGRVRQACLAALRHCGDEELNPLIMPFLRDSLLQVRTEALIFLFTRGGIEGILAGAEELKQMLASSHDKDLAAAAYALGEIGLRYFRQDFLFLLRHHSVSVQRTALKAARHGLPSELVEACLPLLQQRELARHVRRALAHQPIATLLPLCRQHFGAVRQNPSLQVELIRLVGMFDQPEALRCLLDWLQEPDIRIKYQVLQSLHTLRREQDIRLQDERSRIMAQIHREFYYGYSYYYLLQQLQEAEKSAPRLAFLSKELHYRIAFVQEMLFKLLGLLYPSTQMEQAWLNYRSQSSRFRSLSLEVLSYTLEQRLLEPVLTFLDDLSYTQKITLATERGWIDASISNWWQSQLILEDPWLLRLSQWGREIPGHTREEQKMFHVLDHMFLLKQTPLFKSFSAEQLYPVATAAREMFVPARSLIFEQDQPGDAFYIISKGRVQIERKRHPLTILGPREGFGELEILTAAPRIATVRTLADCELLVINREDFIDLVEEYSDFSRSLLEVLSQRLSAHALKLGATGPLALEDSV